MLRWASLSTFEIFDVAGDQKKGLLQLWSLRALKNFIWCTTRNQSGFIYLLPKIVQSAKFEAKYFCDEKRLRPFLQRPPFKGCSGSKFHYRYSLQLFLSKSYSFHLFFSDRNNLGDFISGTGLCEKVLDLCQCYEAKFLFHKLKPNISSKFWASSSSMMAASYRKARFDH